MSEEKRRRGGAPVGLVTELPEVEMGAVLYLRLWCDGPEAQAQVWNDFASGLGARHGRSALKAFERLCSMAVDHGRRPLMRHQITCRCLGADEAAFANLIGAAAEGERDDAMILASIIVRPDLALSVAALAEEFGLALKRLLMHGQLTGKAAGSREARVLH